MPIPDYETLMLPVLRLFADGAPNVAACIPSLQKQFQITDEEAAQLLPSGRIDGIIHEDALGLDAVYVRAKRYAPENRVSRPDVQRFIGSLTGEGQRRASL